MGPFRDKAIARGIAVEDVERWMGTARPCVTLAEGGDGPVVGRFGGPLLLPVGMAHPVYPFVASIDLAALPDGATDLPLPPDGRLLLFAYPEDPGDLADLGDVVYVPVGTAVEERDKNAWNQYDIDEEQEVFERYPQETLRATVDVCLPWHHAVDIPEAPYSETLPGHPRAEELAEVWEETHGEIASAGPLQIGGYADEEAVYTDPVAKAVHCAVRCAEEGSWGGGEAVSGDLADWVLLADWNPDIRGQEGVTVHWCIQRADLAARRFDRAFTTVFWNP